MAIKQLQLPWADPRAKIDRLKPFEEYQKRRDQALAKLRSPVVEEDEAEICWGQPGNFTFDDIPGVTITLEDPDKDKPPKKGKQVLRWPEFQRGFKKIRVENPDDKEQYVIIERIEWIAFTAPSQKIEEWPGQVHRFDLKNRDKTNK